MAKCACGCGKDTPLWERNDTWKGGVLGQPRKYIPGHHLLGTARGEAISRGKKGKPNGRLGFKMSEETKAKIGAAHRGRKSPATSERMRGVPKSAETRARISATWRARPKGSREVAARDGDRQQAGWRVNHLIRVGVLPKPSTLPCNHCGLRLGEGKAKKHEYHHYLGYAPEHHEDVVPLCTSCHRLLHTRRDDSSKCSRGHDRYRQKRGDWYCPTCRKESKTVKRVRDDGTDW